MKRCVRCRKEMDDDALFCPQCGASQPGRTADQILGTVVAGRYLVQKVLGKGGTGTVYRARHVGLGTHVALKLLHYELSRDETAIERFRKEAVTIASIDNEHILRVFDFGRAEDGRFFMAMELLEGQTLEETLRMGPLELGRAVDIALQVADVLGEVHSRGFVHRALRPRNIFLAERKGRKDFVKLLEFGMAKLVRGMDGGGTASAVRFVDPVYLSPEQAQGLPVDRRTDVYSLGVVLYEMLTGRPPFTGRNALELLARQTESLPEPPSRLRPELSGRLDAVVLKALAKRPESRHESMEALAEALMAVVGRQEPSPGALPAEGAAQAAERARGPGETWDRGLAPPESSAAHTSSPGDLPPDRTILGMGGLPLAPGDVAAEAAEDGRAPVRSPGSAPEADDARSVPAVPAANAAGADSAPRRPPQTQAPPAAGPPDTGPSDEATLPSPGDEASAEREAASSGPTRPEPEVPATGDVEARHGAEAAAPEPEAVGGQDEEAPTGGPSGEPPDPTMSQLWYAEGEEAQRQLAEMMARAEEESETEHVLPAVYERLDEGRRRAAGRLVLLVGLSTLALVAGLFGLLLFLHGRRAGEKQAGPPRLAAVETLDAGPAARDAASGTGSPTDARPGSGGEAGAAPARDAGLLLLPADEVLVPAARPVRHRPSRGRRRGAREGRPRATSVAEPARPGPEPRPSAASEELRAGRAALRSGDLAAAERHFRAALAAGAKARALAGLGEVAFERGRHAEAIRLLTRAVRAGAGLSALVLLGNAYFKAGRLKQAKAVYEKVLRRRPGHREAKRNLDIVLKRLGEGPGT